MDRELVNVINFIQSFKEHNYKIHGPKLIDGRQILSHKNTDTQPKMYVRLMQKQRQLLYHHDFTAIEESEKRDKTQASKIKIALKDTTLVPTPHQIHNSSSDSITTVVGDFHRPWHKLPNNLKIQSILRFIENLVPQVSGEHKSQLKFLLISSVSQKKLQKQTDVEYDMVNGYLKAIHQLSYIEDRFIMSDETPNFPFNVTPPSIETPKKKILLKIKS